jgi:hypothetical protein
MMQSNEFHMISGVMQKWSFGVVEKLNGVIRNEINVPLTSRFFFFASLQHSITPLLKFSSTLIVSYTPFSLW